MTNERAGASKKKRPCTCLLSIHRWLRFYSLSCLFISFIHAFHILITWSVFSSCSYRYSRLNCRMMVPNVFICVAFFESVYVWLRLCETCSATKRKPLPLLHIAYIRTSTTLSNRSEAERLQLSLCLIVY